MHANLIILAGGASSRMNNSLELGHNVPKVSKALIGMDKDGRPILDYLLYNAEKAGYKNVYLVVGEHSEGFKKCYGNKTKNNTFKGLNISYAIQYIPKHRAKPFGTADALFQALEQYPNLQNEAFTVCNSDNLYSVEAFSVLKNSRDNHAFIAYNRDGLNFTMDRISRFALVLLDSENYLVDIVEKPSTDTIDSFKDRFGKFRVSMNIFKFNGKEIYPFLKDCPIHPKRDEKELPIAVLNMCNSIPRAMKGFLLSEHVPDLTSKEDISILKTYIQEHYKT
ncbi:MAG TPA: sugar phosphate nucleotidyltransferase [Flavobacteriaceae bacterium]